MAWYGIYGICSMISVTTCNTKRHRRKMPIQALAILLSKASEVSEHFQPNPQTGLQKSFPAVQLSESSSSSSQACKVSDSSSRATNASNNLGAFFLLENFAILHATAPMIEIQRSIWQIFAFIMKFWFFKTFYSNALCSSCNGESGFGILHFQEKSWPL